MSNMNQSTAVNTNSSSKEKDKDGKNAEHKPVLDFTSLPPEELEAYISYYNLAKPYPPILSTKPPTRSNPDSNSTKPLSRRTGRSTEIDHNPSDNTLIGRKRTAATMEMEERTSQEQTGSISTSTSSTKFNGLDLDKNGDFLCPSHFSDMDHANHYLGNVASKHFQNQPAPKEGEAVVGFLYRCATKDKVLKIA